MMPAQRASHGPGNVPQDRGTALGGPCPATPGAGPPRTLRPRGYDAVRIPCFFGRAIQPTTAFPRPAAETIGRGSPHAGRVLGGLRANRCPAPYRDETAGCGDTP